MTETAVQGSIIAPRGMAVVRLLARPKIVGITCLVVLAGLGWVYLGLMVAGAERPDAFGSALIQALCRPVAGLGVAAEGFGSFALVLAMWCAMVLAMMLPAAGPMVLTYADIAETASAKGEPVVSPSILIAGYVTVWLGFALAATLVQWLLARAAPLDPSMAPERALVSGAIFIVAGAYQFSALKHACLTRCQRPFPFLFANWSAVRGGVFALGLRQGLDCLGCCWAMMLVMFAVGVMNVVWMAALGLIMALEKLAAGPRFSRSVGVGFIAIGVAVGATAVWLAA
jgi:predicted metal-binding membrane protein